MDATAWCWVWAGGRRSCMRGCAYVAGLHVHHEERVALGTAHHLPGVQPLRCEHLCSMVPMTVRAPAAALQLPHREAAHTARHRVRRARQVAPRAHLAPLQVVHQERRSTIRLGFLAAAGPSLRTAAEPGDDELGDDEPSAASWGAGLSRFLLPVCCGAMPGGGWVAAWEDRAGKPGEETRTGERSGRRAAARAAVTRLQARAGKRRWREGLRERSRLGRGQRGG